MADALVRNRRRMRTVVGEESGDISESLRRSRSALV
jgi:hypothetical protein